MNYKESVLTGQKWQRAHMITVANSLGGIPWVKFAEEVVTELSDGQVIHHPAGELIEEMTDPATTFALVNPLDGAVIGQSSYQELQVLLYSLYFHLAGVRDAEQQAAAAGQGGA